jgi:hypothetical protein
MPNSSVRRIGRADCVLREGPASLRDLPRLLESASLEERKQFVNAFISRVTVQPDERRLDLEVRTLPVIDPNSFVGVVAGRAMNHIWTPPARPPLE